MVNKVNDGSEESLSQNRSLNASEPFIRPTSRGRWRRSLNPKILFVTDGGREGR